MTTARPGRYVALLRGVNVGGHNMVPMAKLRALCEELGWESVDTYIQSGNVTFSARGTATSLESKLEHALEKAFGVAVPALVRSEGTWRKYVAGNPFSAATKAEPKLVLLALSKKTPKAGASKALQERAVNGEEVAAAAGALWIHYASGVGRSKLTPGLLDKAVGSPVTTRNWLTVLRLAEMLEAGD